MNVLATGRAAAILRERRIVLPPKVRAEALYIYADASKAEKTGRLVEQDIRERVMGTTSVKLDAKTSALNQMEILLG